MIDTPILTILTTHTLSVWECGILTMIDTQILAIFWETQIFETVETSLYSQGFVSRTVWNTNGNRYSVFGHFWKMWKRLHFLILPIFFFFFFFLNVETSLDRNVSMILPMFWKCGNVSPHFLILSSYQYFIIVSIPHSGTLWNTNDDRYSDFGHFFLKI